MDLADSSIQIPSTGTLLREYTLIIPHRSAAGAAGHIMDFICVVVDEAGDDEFI